MLTLTSLGGATVQLQAGKKTLVIFPDPDRAPAEDELLFFGSPEEQPRPGTISWPGEYDIGDLAILGIGHEEGKEVSYTIEVEGVRFAFIHSPLKEWSDYELELLGDVDVLCISSDSPKILQKLTDEIDPRVLVPLSTGGAEKYAESLKICGASGKEPVEKYVVKAGGMPAEGREVVVLKAQK